MNKAKYLNDVITPFEAENLIQRLIPLSIQTYCSEDMVRKYALIERLNMQSHKNSLLGSDDFILNACVLEDKVKELIRDLFIIDLFKVKIYPLIKSEIMNISSIKTYICLHFESIVLNLLEKFFYYATACQAAENYLIDIIEYCYLKIRTYLINSKFKLIFLQSKEDKNIDYKESQINFSIAMACLSIIRYITDHLEQLSFPITNHLLNSKDIPMILVELMEVRPWELYEDNSLKMVFSDNNWVNVNDNKNLLTGLNKYEGQVWISLYNLFLLQGQKYEITDFRKNVLLKLKKYMNQKLYDTLPPLINLYRALEEMNISNSTQSSSSNKSLIIEQIPELYMFNYGNKNKLSYQDISQHILLNYFKNADLKKEMSIISEVYTSDNLDYFMENPNCASCGKEATSRCSQCKAEWYCSKECQILRWKSGHKEFCMKMKEMNKEIKETLN